MNFLTDQSLKFWSCRQTHYWSFELATESVIETCQKPIVEALNLLTDQSLNFEIVDKPIKRTLNLSTNQSLKFWTRNEIVVFEFKDYEMQRKFSACSDGQILNFFSKTCLNSEKPLHFDSISASFSNETGTSPVPCLRLYSNSFTRDILNDRRLFSRFPSCYCCVNKFKVRLISRRSQVYHSHWFISELSPINHALEKGELFSYLLPFLISWWLMNMRTFFFLLEDPKIKWNLSMDIVEAQIIYDIVSKTKEITQGGVSWSRGDFDRVRERVSSISFSSRFTSSLFCDVKNFNWSRKAQRRQSNCEPICVKAVSVFVSMWSARALPREYENYSWIHAHLMRFTRNQWISDQRGG